METESFIRLENQVHQNDPLYRMILNLQDNYQYNTQSTEDAAIFYCKADIFNYITLHQP